eukprot:m.439667 g.439667  ORF g.439667 m.439667 type:complete len:1248 (+) comp18410_c0_seq1:450-4193(+)
MSASAGGAAVPPGFQTVTPGGTAVPHPPAPHDSRVVAGEADQTSRMDAPAHEHEPKNPCPICLANEDDSGEVGMCYACGALFCGECNTPDKIGRLPCPTCRYNLPGVPEKTIVELLHKLLRTRNEGRHTAHALHILGSAYIKGKGVEKDVEKGARMVKGAADRGCVAATVTLGICYERGDGVAKDLAKAIALYTEAAAKPHTNRTAQFNLGNCYLRGLGIAVDVNAAARLFAAAAEQGFPPAMYCLGDCYARAVGVERNPQEAVKWYDRSASFGCPFAMNRLGDCYQHGVGVSPDVARGVKYYRHAAERGHSPAQYNLGCIYLTGFENVNPDLDIAVRWLTAAAKQNHGDASFVLGLCYTSGCGVVRDFAAAGECFRRAAVQGNKKVTLDHPSAPGGTLPCFSSQHGTAPAADDAGPAVAVDHEAVLKEHKDRLYALQQTHSGAHPDVIDAQFDVAAAYSTLGRHHNALKYQEDILSFHKLQSPPDHAKIAALSVTCAFTLSALGRHQSALKLLESALERRQRVLSDDHADVISTVGSIALTLTRLGRHHDYTVTLNPLAFHNALQKTRPTTQPSAPTPPNDAAGRPPKPAQQIGKVQSEWKEQLVGALKSGDPRVVKRAMKIGRATTSVVFDMVLSLSEDEATRMWSVLFRSDDDGGDSVDYASPALTLIRDLKAQRPKEAVDRNVLPSNEVLRAAFDAHDFVLAIYFDNEMEHQCKFANDYILPLLYTGDGGSTLHPYPIGDVEAASMASPRSSTLCGLAVDIVRNMETAAQAAYPPPYSDPLAGCVPAAVIAARCRDIATEEVHREVRIMVMGPAGTGKTTLINAIFGFSKAEQVRIHDRVVSELRENGVDVPEPDLSSSTRTFIPYSVVFQVDNKTRPEPVPVSDVTEYIRMDAQEGQVKVTMVDSPGCTRDLVSSRGATADSGLPAYGTKVMEEIEAIHPVFGGHGPLGGVVWVVHAIEARVQTPDQQFMRWLDRVGLPITFVCTFAYSHPKTVEKYIQNVEKEGFHAIRAFVPVQSLPEDPDNVQEGEAGWNLTKMAESVSKIYHAYPPVTFIANKAERHARVKEIIKWGVARAGSAGLIPLPFIDDVAAAVSNVKMVSDILRCYPREFRETMRPLDVIRVVLLTSTLTSPSAFVTMSAIGLLDLAGDGLKSTVMTMGLGMGVSVTVHLILSVILGFTCFETLEDIHEKKLPQIIKMEMMRTLKQRGQAWIKQPRETLKIGKALAEEANRDEKTRSQDDSQ